MMHATVQKWGNSQAVRIPRGALQLSLFKPGDKVEIIAQENQITLRRLITHQSLDSLFEGYTGQYQPSEVDTGSPVGREVI